MASITSLDGIWHDMQGRIQSLTDRLQQHYFARQQRHQANEVAVATQADNRLLRETYTEYEIRQETSEVLIRIIDADNGELVRTIPSEEFAKEVASGQFHTQRVRRRNVQA